MSETPSPAGRDGVAGRDRLLATKLSIPRARPERLTRERLTAALEGGMNRTLVLACTHPGSAKKSLIAEWAREPKWPVA
jgi:ATP/maltotriose-dependent transcriptional regulator MalT